MNRKRVTLRDIAHACGVDTSTVSRVLNNRMGPRFSVTKEKAERIRETAQRLGYEPNRFAKSLRERRSPLIGVSFPSIHGELDVVSELINDPRNPAPVAANLMTGIIEACHQRNYFATSLPRLERLDGSAISEREILPDLVAGVLYIRPTSQHHEYVDYSRQGAHIVLVGSCPIDAQVPQIDIDNRHEMQRLTARVIEAGASRPLLFMTAPPLFTLVQDREQGFRQALAEAGLPANHGQLIHENTATPRAFDRLRQALLEQPAPDALILGTNTDYYALVRVLESIHPSADDRPLLASFDSEALLFPRLFPRFWVELPYFQWGMEATNYLIDLIEARPLPPEMPVPPCRVREETF